MTQLEPLAAARFAVATSALARMRAHCLDTPYPLEKGAGAAGAAASRRRQGLHLTRTGTSCDARL